MSDRTVRITRIGSVAGYVVAAAGFVALVTIALFWAVGQPWGTLNDISLLVMMAALAPLMLTFYELGGRTPLRPAQLAQTIGQASIVVWCLLQAGLILGVVEFDYFHPASGPFLIGSLAWGYIGLWIAGGNLLAGPWLSWIRWLGVIAGVGGAILAFGLIRGGVDSGWTYLGGLGFEVILPAWAFLMGRLLAARLVGGRLGREPEPEPEPGAA